MNDDKALTIALFRFSLISALIHADNEDAISKLADEISSKTYDIPFSKRKRVSKKSILRYLSIYIKYGFEGLKRKDRNDKNLSRTFNDELLSEIIKLKKENPKRSPRIIITLIKQYPNWENVLLAERTVSRIFKNNNLSRKNLLPKKIYRRFEMEHINELWEADAMDGLFIQNEKKKTYLFAFIDDHSRLIPHAQFYYDEKLPRLEDCLKKAILKRGIPKAIYTDNGKVFVSTHLKRICAELGIRLIHHLPYSPQSKGKIERFFLRVQTEFLLEAESSGVGSIIQLNSYFQAWLEVSYHRTEHQTTGETPLDRFIKDMTITKIRKVETLEEITEKFLYRDTRQIHKTGGFIRLFGNQYRVSDYSLLGKIVEIRYDPYDISKIFIYLENKFVQVSYPSSINNQKAVEIPEENKQTKNAVRKSSMDFFIRLKQKEIEINKKESHLIDFSKLVEDKNDK